MMSEDLEGLIADRTAMVAGAAAAEVLKEYLQDESRLLRELFGIDADRTDSPTLLGRRAKRDAQFRIAPGDPHLEQQIDRLRVFIHRYDDQVDAGLQDRTFNDLEDLGSCRRGLFDRIGTYIDTMTEFGVLDAGSGSELRGLVAAHVDEVNELLLGEPAASPERLGKDLRSVRRQRAAGLHLLAIRTPAVSNTRLHDALADYDTAIDGVVALAASTERPVNTTYVKEAARSLAARVHDDELSERRSLWIWVAAAGLGLAAIVVGFAVGSRTGDLGWTSASIVLAGLGAVLAATYTYAGSGGFPWWTRTVLLGLPITVFSLTLVLPGLTVDERTVASLLATLVVIGLAGISTSVVWRDHNRSASSGTETPWFMSVPWQDDPQENSSQRPLFGELELIRRRIAEEAHAQKVAAHWWAATFILVGGLAALLSGAAGVTATQPQEGISSWVGPLAIAGAGLTALTTALNPGRRWEQAHTLRLACRSLEQEVRVLLRVDLAVDGDVDGRAKLEEIATKYDTLLGVPERPRLWTRPSQSGS